MNNNTYFPVLHRLIHWGIAFGMLFILLTILLRMGWMEKHHIASMLMAAPQLAGAALSESDAIKIAKSIRNVMFQWHILVGYAVAVLFVIRMSYTKVKGIFFVSPFDAAATPREKIQAWTYISFYAFLGLSLISGLLIKFGPESLEEVAEDLHVLGLWYLVPFLVLHLGGIVMGELTNEKGLISRMIGGTRP